MMTGVKKGHERPRGDEGSRIGQKTSHQPLHAPFQAREKGSISAPKKDFFLSSRLAGDRPGHSLFLARPTTGVSEVRGHVKVILGGSSAVERIISH